jgi:hypothetical protein
MTPRTGAQLILAHGLLYLIGGFTDAADLKPVHTVSVFDVAEEEWTFGPNPPILGFSGSGYSAAVAANAVGDPDAADGDALDVHVFGGVSDDGSPVKSHTALRLFAPSDPSVSGVAHTHAAIRTVHRKTATALPRAPIQAESKPVATGAAGVLPVLPGVDFLGLGFDLVKANPLAEAAGMNGEGDSAFSSLGWSSMPVYDASCVDCFASNTTLAGKWRVPDSVDVNVLESCSMQTENRVVSSMRELQVAFDEFAFLRGHVGLGKLSWLVSARFMGGEEVKSSLQTEIARGNSLLLGTARCESYRIGFTSVKSRKTHLWPSFSAAVAALPATPPGALDSADDHIWLDFIARYGTHVPTSITMGARATQISVLEKAKLTEALTSSAGYALGINVRILLFFGIGTSDYGKLTAHNDVEFDELVTANYSRCIPSCPPDQPSSNTSNSSSTIMNTSAWMADVSERPSPIDVELMPIAEFIREQLGNDSARATALETFFETKYCNYLPGCTKPEQELTVGPLDLLHAAEFTTSRTGAAIAAFDGQLWVAGGVDATGQQYPGITHESGDSTGAVAPPYCAYNTTEVLDLVSSVWSSADQSHSLNRTQKKPDALGPLCEGAGSHYGAGSVTVGDTLYLIGGQTRVSHEAQYPPSVGSGARLSAEVVALNMTSREWVTRAPMPRPRTDFSVVMVGSMVYVIGGVEANVTTGAMLSTPAGVLQYAPAKDAWTEVAMSNLSAVLLPKAAAAVALGTDVWLLGGYAVVDAVTGEANPVPTMCGKTAAQCLPLADVVVYSTTNHSVTKLQVKLPLPTSHAAAVPLVGGKIMLLGGYVFDPALGAPAPVVIPSNQTAVLDAARSSWEDLSKSEPLPSPMAPCSATIMLDDANMSTVFALGGVGVPAQVAVPTL